VRLSARARERQFIDHLAPVWHELPAEVKNNFYVPDRAMQEHAALQGIDAIVDDSSPTELTLVASFGDYQRTSGPVILMEHGIGHKYSNHGSYAGGAGKDRVVLYLATNKVTKQHHLDGYPDTPVAIIGVPKMDTVKPRPPKGRTVCISFHWDCRVSPESRSAFDHYKNFLNGLTADKRFNLIAHAHPRPAWHRKMMVYFRDRRVPFLNSFDEVLEQADLYITDNSSTGYEFAAAGRNTIHLNAPWYRRDIDTGIRFWGYLPGPTVDRPSELADTIAEVLDHPERWEKQRQQVVRDLYPYRGKSAQRAAKVITDFIQAQ
jgi:hypothetical protein